MDNLAASVSNIDMNKTVQKVDEKMISQLLKMMQNQSISSTLSLPELVQQLNSLNVESMDQTNEGNVPSTPPVNVSRTVENDSSPDFTFQSPQMFTPFNKTKKSKKTTNINVELDTISGPFTANQKHVKPISKDGITTSLNNPFVFNSKGSFSAGSNDLFNSSKSLFDKNVSVQFKNGVENVNNSYLNQTANINTSASFDANSFNFSTGSDFNKGAKKQIQTSRRTNKPLSSSFPERLPAAPTGLAFGVNLGHEADTAHGELNPHPSVASLDGGLFWGGGDDFRRQQQHQATPVSQTPKTRDLRGSLEYAPRPVFAAAGVDSGETSSTSPRSTRPEEAGPVLFSMGSTVKSGRPKTQEKVAHTPLFTAGGSFHDFVFDGHNLPTAPLATPFAQRSQGGYSLGASDLLDDDDDELPPYTPAAAGLSTPSVRMTTSTSSANSRFLRQQQLSQQQDGSFVSGGGFSMGAAGLLGREEDSPSNPDRHRVASEDDTASLGSEQGGRRMTFGVDDDSDEGEDDDGDVLLPTRIIEGEDSLGSLLFQFHSAQPASAVAPDARSSEFSFPVPPSGDLSAAQPGDTLSAHMNEAFHNIDINGGPVHAAAAAGGTSFAFNMGSNIKPKRRGDWGAKKTAGSNNSGGVNSSNGSAFLFASFDKDTRGSSQQPAPSVFPSNNSNVFASSSSSSSRPVSSSSSSFGAGPSTPSDAPPGWWFNNANINISNSYPAMDSDNDTEDDEEQENSTYDFSRPLPSRQQQAMPPPAARAPLFDSGAAPKGGLGSFPFAPPTQPPLPSLAKTSPVRPLSGYGGLHSKSAMGPSPSVSSGSDPHTIRMAELYGTQGKDAYAQEKYTE